MGCVSEGTKRPFAVSTSGGVLDYHRGVDGYGKDPFGCGLNKGNDFLVRGGQRELEHSTVLIHATETRAADNRWFDPPTKVHPYVRDSTHLPVTRLFLR